MTDRQAKRPSTHLRVHNVSLHRRGRAEYGTLSVEKHHLRFSYAPSSSAATKTEPQGAVPALATESSAASRKTTDSDGTVQTHSSGGTETNGLTTASSKARAAETKSIWIAFPMINYCVLRPSHTQSTSTRLPAQDSGFQSTDDDEDLFPPTFGTSSFTERPSTDSARLAPYSSPMRPSSPSIGTNANSVLATESGRPPAIRLRCRDFQMMAFHFHNASSEQTPDEAARQVFFEIRTRCCVHTVKDLLAFHFVPPPQESAAEAPKYDAVREYSRMGIGEKTAEGPGSAWRISRINQNYSFSATYPSIICVPQAVSDNMLKYGGSFRSRSRIPCLSYLHFNGGSITRSSQPMVGVAGKRSPQDERLVSAIFSSQSPNSIVSGSTPVLHSSLESGSTVDGQDDVDSLSAEPTTTERGEDHIASVEEGMSPEEVVPNPRKIYGSTRTNYIVDARPKMNVLANRATGGGIEDLQNYTTPDSRVEKVFLNIANIHVMRSSLEKVIESLANSDYVSLPPNQDALRKSGWLSHIAGLIEGADMVARVVGLGGSHALVHCSDGWDRTAQISALAQVMLDPHARTLLGFITLVQKDFLSFGHKFHDRNGIRGSEKWFEIENERIAPSKPAREDSGSEGNGINSLGSKALSGAKNWFEKNRSTLFRQQNASADNLAERTSAPASPPPNPVLHAIPTNSPKDDKKHDTRTDEIAPIFHQFLDAVYQLLRQRPNAFEFNERFLLRLLYQSYSGQYGEFLFNNERERLEHKDKVPSVWSHFLARREQFINPDYNAKAEDDLLLAQRGLDRAVDVKWWHKLFGREDSEMNVPRALAPTETITNLENKSTASSIDLTTPATPEKRAQITDERPVGVDTPTSMFRAKESLSSTFSALGISKPQRTDPAVVQAKPIESLVNEDDLATPTATRPDPLQSRGEDDPLGALQENKAKASASSPRLDFRAFASQNAFSER